MSGGVLLHNSTPLESLGFEAFENIDLGTAPTLVPGERLRRARVARGLTLADIAARTRVSQQHLAAIEGGNLSSFQARVYAVGSARSYARAVEIDEAVVVAAIGAAYRAPSPRAPALGRALPQRRRGTPSPLLYRMAGVMLAALFGFAVLAMLTRG